MTLLYRPNECTGFVRYPAGGLPLVMAGHRYEAAWRGSMAMVRPVYLFTYVYDGGGRVGFEGGRREAVSPGDWFLAFPDQIVQYEENRATPWRYYWIGFRGDHAASLLAGIGITPRTLVRRGEPGPEVPAVFDAIMADLENGGRASMLSAVSGLWRLLAILGRDNQPSAEPSGGGGFDTYIHAARGFIENHFAEGITAGDVARHVGFERTYFSTRFRAETGRTIREVLTEARMARAGQLLRETDLRIVEIARAVGYDDARSFTRWFGRAAGMPPGAWRRQNESRDGEAWSG